ncbi:ferredoxin, 2Fe-2S [Sphingobium faniae]|nr:ferredoxin, 2Fe-2S [Sphingobium faniae]
MPKIRFVQQGTEYAVEAPDGISAMEAALNAGVPGIDGDCGGQCACATCHVYVDPAWMPVVGPADADTEQLMIDLNEGVQANSRLACQVQLTDEMNGLLLLVPDAQF